ncbi:hypothetical protein GCM10010399_93200 [Dactylosporangium fulvum]|uniref:Bacterial Pleckstrin homology domain-containing protein n=1 Tax=Dactylosporangium fulvum TaxID=53359 RepID=A0ABY5VP91_9ACTN|nr:hypothetical protein [Dactylosporangium fulvum]UWP79552.1 hypothetical protein Dfulv_30850 [Dactylosporangium fulvum]
MGTVTLDADRLRVRLSVAEKVGGLHGDLDIPRDAIVSAEVVEDGLAAVKGLRAPGLAVPGVTKIGTWLGRGSRRFAVVRRGLPALRITLRGQRYDTVVVSTPDAAALAGALRRS